MQKYYIVNFNAYKDSAVPTFHLYNQQIKERASFTYLGMLFDKHISSHEATSHALRPLNAAIRRVKEFGLEKKISDRPHTMLWLFKTYALSAGMYVCAQEPLQFYWFR